MMYLSMNQKLIRSFYTGNIPSLTLYHMIMKYFYFLGIAKRKSGFQAIQGGRLQSRGSRSNLSMLGRKHLWKNSVEKCPR